jgi:hypothetical protein
VGLQDESMGDWYRKTAGMQTVDMCLVKRPIFFVWIFLEKV